MFMDIVDFFNKNQSINNEAFHCLCFYFQPEVKVSNTLWFERTCSTLKKYGIEIKYFSWDVANKNYRSSIENFIKKSNANLVDLNEASFLDIYSAPLQREPYYSYVEAYFNGRFNGNFPQYFMVRISDRLITNENFKLLFLDYASSLHEDLNIAYGFHYFATAEQIGSVSNFPISTSSLNFYDESGSKWYKNVWGVEPPWVPGKNIKPMQLHLKGKFRHVYSLNIIKNIHLNQKMNGESLIDWINSTPSHGVLKRLGDDLFLWEIDENDLLKIQMEMHKNKLLIAVKTNSALE